MSPHAATARSKCGEAVARAAIIAGCRGPWESEGVSGSERHEGENPTPWSRKPIPWRGLAAGCRRRWRSWWRSCSMTSSASAMSPRIGDI